MSFFDQILSGLFPDSKQPCPMVHELMNRSARFLTGYTEWRKQDKNFILSKIWKAYGYKKAKLGETELTVHLLNSKTANGFAVIFDPLLSTKEEFRYVMEYFKDKILTLGYKKANADRKMEDKTKFVTCTERYYLKPIVDHHQDGVINQKYGNITIEHVLNDDVPNYLKVMISAYSDRNYTEALPPGSLFQFLLKES